MLCMIEQATRSNLEPHALINIGGYLLNRCPCEKSLYILPITCRPSMAGPPSHSEDQSCEPKPITEECLIKTKGGFRTKDISVSNLYLQ